MAKECLQAIDDGRLRSQIRLTPESEFTATPQGLAVRQDQNVIWNFFWRAELTEEKIMELIRVL